jgi:hypothetical protein
VIAGGLIVASGTWWLNRKEPQKWLEKITIIDKAKKGKTSAAGRDQTDKPSGLTGESGNDRRPPPPRFDGDVTEPYTCPMHLNYRNNKLGKRPRCHLSARWR